MRQNYVRKNLRQCQTCSDYEGETDSYEYLQVKLCRSIHGEKMYLCEECISTFNQSKPGYIQVIGL